MTITGASNVSIHGLALKPATSELEPTAAKKAIVVNKFDGASSNHAQLRLTDCKILGTVDCSSTRLEFLRCTVSGPTGIDADGDAVRQDYGIQGSECDISVRESIVSSFQTGIWASDSALRGEKLRIRDCDYAASQTKESLSLIDFEITGCRGGIRISDSVSPFELRNGSLTGTAESVTRRQHLGLSW
ncbi:MAG: hypothetical protein QM811_12215 [Pirellulales bacterium]